MANIASLRVPTSPVQAIDTGSWIDGLMSKAGDALDNKVAGDLIAQSLSTGQTQGAAQTTPTGVRQPAPQQQQSQSFAAPVGAVSRGPAQGSTYAPFIETVRGGGLTNPYGLSAVAAYGKAESGWSGENANRTWADPSESGAAGTSGGILSWRGPRLASLQNYAQSKGERGNGSPQTQAEFFLQENPQVIQALNSAKSPQEANAVLANAWKFAGYDKPGGENARRAALTQNYYAQEFGNAPAPQAEGGFDAGRFASGPVAQGPEGLATALAGNAQAMQANNAPMPGVDPTTTGATDAPPIVATPTNSEPVALGAPVDSNQLAGPVTQLTRQNLSPDLIRRMVQNPVTRQLGLSLAQQVLGGGKASEPWQFVKLANGDLARANQQTGAIERVGNFAKNTKDGGSEAGLNLVYGKDANGTTVAFQPLKGGGLRQVELPAGVELTPGVTNTDLGTSVITRESKTGKIIDTQRKDVAGVAEQTTQGKAKGEAAAELPAVTATANMVSKQIQELKDDPYLPNMLGSMDARLPNISSDAARVQARMNQLQGGAFLQARQMLKGGGAITDFEGAKAEDAYARLNAAQNENDYKTALDDFNEAVQIGLRKLEKQAGAVPTQSNNYKDRYGLE